MRYIVTLIVGFTLSFGVNAATLQEKCSFGANFAQKVAKARLSGHSEKQVLSDLANTVDTRSQYKSLANVVTMVYDFDYRQVRQHEAVKALFYNACMKANSTGS